MSDRRKKGRKNKVDKQSVEAKVSRAWRHNQRSWMTEAVTGNLKEPAHMRLARQFGIPCQQVLDIIDPDRARQQRRIEAHANRQAHEAEFQRLLVKYQPVMETLESETDEGRRFELKNEMRELYEFLDVPIRKVITS